jgi:uncharacterized coiled-coil protein SlyX
MFRKFGVAMLIGVAALAFAVSADAATLVQHVVSFASMSNGGYDFGGALGAIGFAAMGVGSVADTKLAKSKMFRVAVEGATVDGRLIERSWLTQAAANYNPTVYGARVNMEHIKGYSASSDFRAYGDVLALSASEITDGPLKGKMALYAQIQPTADLVKLTAAMQKVYTSCEFSPSFADTKQAYLVGLAVTDSPASLGTEILAFSAAHPNANLFSVAEETTIEFEEQEQPSHVAQLFAKVTGLLSGAKKKEGETAAQFADVSQAVEALAQHGAEQAEAIENLTAQLAAANEAAKKDREAFAALVQKLGATDAGAARPNATGDAGNSKVKADC